MERLDPRVEAFGDDSSSARAFTTESTEVTEKSKVKGFVGR
jgi:hypothetical protein